MFTEGGLADSSSHLSSSASMASQQPADRGRRMCPVTVKAVCRAHSPGPVCPQQTPHRPGTEGSSQLSKQLHFSSWRPLALVLIHGAADTCTLSAQARHTHERISRAIAVRPAAGGKRELRRDGETTKRQNLKYSAVRNNFRVQTSFSSLLVAAPCVVQGPLLVWKQTALNTLVFVCVSHNKQCCHQRAVLGL